MRSSDGSSDVCSSDLRKPARVIWGHLIRCRAEAGQECRTGSQALHSITMEGANAGEIVSRCAADTDMANFRVQQAVNGRAIYDQSATNARAYGEIARKSVV